MPDQSSAATEHAILQEITAPLERLPEDPLSLVDVEFPAAMRGYDRGAVDEYVARTHRLVAELHETRSPEAAVRRALERVGEQISGILQRAHETAEQITAQSRAEAEDRMEAARREAAQIVSSAQERVAELDADTDRIWAERQRIVGDAEELSAQLSAVARDAAQRFPEDGDAPAGEPAVAFEAPLAPPEEVAGDGAVDDAETVVEAQTAGVDEESTGDHDLDGDHEPAGGDEPAGGETDEDADGDADPGIERTAAYEPLPLREDRRADAEDATEIIPPASEAAHRRRETE